MASARRNSMARRNMAIRFVIDGMEYEADTPQEAAALMQLMRGQQPAPVTAPRAPSPAQSAPVPKPWERQQFATPPVSAPVIPVTSKDSATPRDIKKLRVLSAAEAAQPINLLGDANIIANALGGIASLLGSKQAYEEESVIAGQQMLQAWSEGSQAFMKGGRYAEIKPEPDGGFSNWAVSTVLRMEWLRQHGMTNGMARDIRTKLEQRGLASTFPLAGSKLSAAQAIAAECGFSPQAGTRIKRNPRTLQNSLWLRAY